MGHDQIILQILNVSKTFLNHDTVEKVLDHIRLDVKKGEIISILGPSGCGKSTLLNIIGGYERPTEGGVLFDGNEVAKPHRRCVTLFQSYGLLPWRSAIKNVELGLEESVCSAEERRGIAFDYLKLVGLKDKADHFPHQLSGGMQQRVAIARALAVKPEVILMDEPFAALDTFNRYYLQDELIRIWEKEKPTILLVTHDIDEAVYLSDRVIIMQANPGRIQKELVINISRLRDRSNVDFQYYRQKIFAEFQLHRREVLDYSI